MTEPKVIADVEVEGFRFVKTKRIPERFPIKVTTKDTFTLLVRKPTFEELVADTEMQEGYAEDRLRLIVGWEGLLNEDHEPITYDWKTFQIVCEQYPTVFMQATIATFGMFRRNPETPSGNSENSSDASSTDETK